MSESLTLGLLVVLLATGIVISFFVFLNGDALAQLAPIVGDDAWEIAARLGVKTDEDSFARKDPHSATGSFGESTVTISKAGISQHNPFSCVISKAPRDSQEFCVFSGYFGSGFDAWTGGNQVSSIKLANDTKVYRALDTELQFSKKQLSALNELAELKIPFKLQNNPGLNELSVAICKDPEPKEAEVIKRLLRVF